jgi:hypothetical protein
MNAMDALFTAWDGKLYPILLCLCMALVSGAVVYLAMRRQRRVDAKLLFYDVQDRTLKKVASLTLPDRAKVTYRQYLLWLVGKGLINGMEGEIVLAALHRAKKEPFFAKGRWWFDAAEMKEWMAVEKGSSSLGRDRDK